MNFDLLRIWHEMDLFARGIVVALTAMAVASAAVLLERLWAFRRAGGLSRAFAVLATRLLDGRQHDELVREAEKHKASPLASLLGAGMRTFIAAQREGTFAGAPPPVELAKREMSRRSDELAAEVRRGLGVIASTGSVAPFVGLLGTVVGIIAAFQGIAKEGSGGIGAVSSGISEALVVTALGLLVAIPAVLAFNFLSTRADAIMLALDRARGELTDHFERYATAPSTPAAGTDVAGPTRVERTPVELPEADIVGEASLAA